MQAQQYTIHLPWGPCTYLLKRSARRSVGLLITDDGLVVSAPTLAPQASVEQVLRSKASWIERSLARWQERKARTTTLTELVAKHGPVPVRGKAYALEYSAQRSGLLNPWTQRIVLPEACAQSEAIRLKKLETVLRHHASEVFAHSARRLLNDRDWPRYTIHLPSPSGRWGSCNSAGQIRLNWRLVHHSPQLIDYVIAHELAHLKEMNHSARFWSIVEELMPDYREPHHTLAQLNPAEVPKP